MKYKFYSSPYKLNEKLKNIKYRNALTKSLNIRNNNNIIQSIPLLTHHFCYLKNNIDILKYYANKIPLLEDNAETFVDHSLNLIKSPNKTISTNYNYLSTEKSTPKQIIYRKTKNILNKNISLYPNKKPCLKFPKRHIRTISSFSSSNENHIGKHIKNFSDLTYKHNKNNERKYEEKIKVLHKKMESKDIIIGKMQNIIDDTLDQLNKVNKENSSLKKKLNRIKLNKK